MIDAQLNLITNVDEAQAFMRWLGERRPVLGLDTETTGLKPYAGDYVRMVQFGDAKTGWAISVHHWRGLIEQALRAYEGPTVWANRKFDRHFLQQSGFEVYPDHREHDTVIMGRLIEPNKAAGLKPTGARLFPGSEVGEMVLKEAMSRGKWTWETIPWDHPAYWAYAAWDPVLTARIAEAYWPRINNEGLRDAYDREMAVQAILYRAERRGIRIDPMYTSTLLAQWQSDADILLHELNQLGLSDPLSARQVAAAMQATEDWDPDDFTETGQAKVDEAVLKGINSQISRRVLRYRRLIKWIGTYLERFLKERDGDDCVHPSINTLQARTGRMSITGIPLQTLPRGPEIRNCIVPRPGGRLVSIDYDTMEMRTFAHFGDIAGLKRAIFDGTDLHSFAAREVYADPTITKDDPRRQLAKNTQFCLIFGGGAGKIAETAGVSVDVAKDFLSMYLNTFPEIKPFMNVIEQVGRARLEAEGAAYIKTWGGRRVPADADRIYALLNYLIQGSCADLFKQKIIEVDAAGLGDHIVVPVHDELVFDFPEDQAEAMAKEAAEIMCEYRAFTVPLTASAGKPAERWGEAK